MRILSGRFQNFCQLPLLEFELAPGMNAFLGPNGSGKSNSVKGIYGTLTNDFSRNPGTKEDNIYQLAGPREPSSVGIVFEHHGAEYRLSRSLRPNRQELVVPGEAPVTRDALVNQRVAQILGVTPEILDKYIFVDQWAMFDFLTATETARAKAFQRLFGTQEAEKAWAAVGDVLARTEAPQEEADIDGQREGLAHHERRLAALARELEPYAGLPERPDPDSADHRAVRDARRREQLDADIRTVGARLAALRRELTAAREEESCFARDRDTLKAAGDGTREAADAAKAALANWQTLKTVQQARARVQLQLDTARSEATVQTEPRKNGLYVSDLDAAVHERRAFLAAEVARGEAFVKSFDPATGVAECPTCFTPADTLHGAVAAARVALPALKAELAEIDERLKYSARYDREEAEYLSWRRGWESRVAGLERQLADLQVIDRPARDEADLRQVVAEANELEIALSDTEKELRAVSHQAGVLQGKVASEEARLAAATAERQALMVVNPEDLADVEARLSRLAVAFQERARLRGEVQSNERDRQAFLDSIALMEARRAEADRARRWVRHLTEVRGVLHRDCLPRMVAEHYLRELGVGTNSFLDTFDAPFRVEADEKLSFRAHFHTGASQPAGRLSGGEKVVLALAFRLSVNSMFAQDVGLLCLDEPTVGLDEHNLGCLQVALERLRELSRARGLQVILVTHERSLGPLFDKVIDLSVTS